MKKIFIFALLFGMSVAAPNPGFMSSITGALSDVGSTFLPEDSMKTGCQSVGLYNREKDGSKPRGNTAINVYSLVGSGLARFGNNIFPREGMVEGCIRAGFYDPNLDQFGNPKNLGNVVSTTRLLLGKSPQRVTFRVV